MFKLLSAAAALAMASAAFAQTTQPGETTPSVTPSDTPAVTPSQTPSVIPPSRPPMIGETAVGGLSRCENMIGMEKDKCLQEERAGTASAAGRAAGAGGTHAPGSTGTAPAGSVR